MEHLPTINASLNALSALLLIAGFVMIRRKRTVAHRNCMMGAFAVSALFLVLYVAHKTWKATQEGDMHTQFNADGWLKTMYLLILLSHLLLAMTVPVFAVLLTWLGLTGRHDTHRRVARWGWPIWMYVSITGVVIYLMLYHWNPAAAAS